MELRIAVPNEHISPEILQGALETATRANEAILASAEPGEIPAVKSAIKQGVRWKPEPRGTGEELALAPTVLERGWGDCDDLAPWLAAELRRRGDKRAQAIAVKTGRKRWHAVVRDGSGQILDPSDWAGMRGQVTIDGDPRIPQLAQQGRRALAVIPTGRGWSARVDLPSRRHPAHICACAHDGDPAAALIRAAQAAAYAAPREAAALDAVVSGLCGIGEDEEEQMGFLGDIAKAVGGVVSSIPIVGNVVRGAAQVARPLVTAASPLLRAASPVVSLVNPAAGMALQALPAAQSLLDVLSQGGRVQGPVAGQVPVMPATPIATGFGPAASLPLPLDQLQQLLALLSYQPGAAQSPILARW